MKKTITQKTLYPDKAENLRTRVEGNEIQISYDMEINEPQSQETILEETKGTKEWLNKYFPVVQASTLSLDDEIIQHEPETKNQKDFKERLIKAIKSGLQDFRAPIMDPSLDKYGNIRYKAGKKPAVGKSAAWWEIKVKEFLPEKESRLGLTKERIAFLALLMKELVAEWGYSVSDAWKAVCDQCKDIGHYRDSINPKSKLEPTGSRKVGRWYDLGNTRKITKGEAYSFLLVGGVYYSYGDLYTLAKVYIVDSYFNRCDSVGWTVLSV